MQNLDSKYLEALEGIAASIQDAEALASYLENEEEDDFIQLKDLFEPQIAELYEEVARENPLQLIAFEVVLLNPAFEGLFLPKILGYSVLRGEINENYKYVRPQDHFRDVLLAICNSANFDILKKRIGQSIQIGFALSSDIWVTNLISEIDNKRVRYFLQSQKLERYRNLQDRKMGYMRYRRQFLNDNFQTAEFPEDLSELPIFFNPLKHFLIYRINLDTDDASLHEPIQNFLNRAAFKGTPEHQQILMLYTYFFDLDAETQADMADLLDEQRASGAVFSDRGLDFIKEIHLGRELDLTPEADLQFSGLLDRDIQDDLARYYELMDRIHKDGIEDEAVQEAVKVFHNLHEGLSTINACVRQTIYHYFRRQVVALTPQDYPQLFEISKLYPIYMGIFDNQQFNQDLKELSMKYVKQLLKTYTDKRGKDYQDIKKFVSTAFVDFGFLKEKETVELFKTRRKKKTT